MLEGTTRREVASFTYARTHRISPKKKRQGNCKWKTNTKEALTSIYRNSLPPTKKPKILVPKLRIRYLSIDQGILTSPAEPGQTRAQLQSISMSRRSTGRIKSIQVK